MDIGSAAILERSQPAWNEPTKAVSSGRPLLSVDEFTNQVRELPLPEPVVIPTPVLVRGRYFLAKVGPPLVFTLAVAGIIWFWPPF